MTTFDGIAFKNFLAVPLGRQTPAVSLVKRAWARTGNSGTGAFLAKPLQGSCFVMASAIGMFLAKIILTERHEV